MFTTDQFKNSLSYEIRVRDHFRAYWSPFFNGWFVKNLEHGNLLIYNTNVDQTGLYDILNKIQYLNLTLLSVRMITTEK